MSSIISAITNFVISTISTLGYPGVALLMAIESACIPLPSEIIMPFSGFLVATGRFNLWGIALAGGIGNTIGSIITYAIGRYGGRPLLEKYGKYILISHRDIDLSDKFFQKHEALAAFFGRLLPVVRTFISLPAGIAKAAFWQFVVYTFVGSFIWSLLLGFIGMKMGENWNTLRDKLHGFDVAIIILIIIGAVWWVYRHIKHRN